MKKAALIILDGFGNGINDPKVNAIEKANIPFIRSLMNSNPVSKLKTSGLDVGLPVGQMGNSEVGHLNIGAGRVVYQMLALIDQACSHHEFDKHPVLTEAFDYAKKNRKKVHLIGLVSNGGVHSSIDHLKALLKAAWHHKVDDVYVHAFTDGRDTDPKSALYFLADLEEYMLLTTGSIASITGRYFAMDRDKRWERVKKAYDNLVHGIGNKVTDPLKAIRESYESGVTDEFIEPINVVRKNQLPVALISDGDVVIFFNFRTDRGRELTTVLTQKQIEGFAMKPLDLHYITMTVYDKTFHNIKSLFSEPDLSMTLGEVIERAGGSQLRIAESEKYPHVTFFFSGGRETPFVNEYRLLVPSPKVATYDLQPEMSAEQVTDDVLKAVENEQPDLIVLNYANPDMVGHTGVFNAVVTALETIDTCLERVVTACKAAGYSIVVTADHGNSDYMVNPDGSPNTAHTTNPVPFIVISNDKKITELKDGRLADIAPTLLKLMEIPQPTEMTGEPLVSF